MLLTIFENMIDEVRLTVRGEWLVVRGVAGANEDENFFYLSTRIYSNKDVFLHVASPVPPSGCYSKLVYFTQNTQKTKKLFAKSNGARFLSLTQMARFR